MLFIRSKRKPAAKAIFQYDSNYEENLDKYLVEKVTKSVRDRYIIRSALLDNFVCSALEEQEIQALIDAMKYYVFPPGIRVIQQNEPGINFFIISSGKFRVYVDDKCVNVMETGKAFGEIALIHDIPRSATVKTETKASAWTVNRKIFR